MNEMRQYVCWRDTAVRASTSRDAASLETGHFQAVHHPLKLRQRPLGDRGRGTRVEETEIVRALEGPLRQDGYLLVPIVGGSGTGKSHLVRWVWNHTTGRANWERRYLPKNRTSLRRVIEIVIKGLEGPAVEAAREALLSAPAYSESEQVLAERLLDELALITAEESAAGLNVTDRRAAQMAEKLRQDLPDILRDPVVRRSLTVDGAVIPRLIGLAMRGRSDGDGLDDASRVVDNDLPLTIAKINEASQGAQRLLGQMGTIPEIKLAAVDLINEALPAAVKRVFVSRHVDLIEILREVRRGLLESGKELVLFIEDLTVLHGVEREFLDAIVEPARQSGGELCGLRVLFAVTEGYFDGLDTVRTRCDDAYRLDTPYGSDGVGHDEAMSFLGRYLNACRLDPEAVESLWINRLNDAWMPNACDDCDYQVHCHETFGLSEEGYGLYPYNPAAVNRFVSALSSERFDPREVVRELVDRFLRVATTDLQRGDFPSDELVRPFDESSEPLDPLLQHALESNHPVDSARIVNSMRYWSETSTSAGDAILAAFGINTAGVPEVSLLSRSRPNVQTPSRRSSDRSQMVQVVEARGEVTLASLLRAPWSRIFDDLNVWAGNQRDLNASATAKLKNLIHKAILDYLDFSALPLKGGESFDQQKRFERDRHLHIAGSVTHQRTSDAIVTIERDASTAAALQGLILLANLPGVDDYRDANRYRRLAADYLEQWADSVAARLQQSPEPAATQAIRGLLLCAIIAGACDGASDPHSYLVTLFGQNASAVSANRSSKWRALVEEAATTYRRLRPVVEAHFAEARGAGGVRAIRADQILPIIQEFTGSWCLEASDPAIDRFMRSVIPAVEAEWEALVDGATDASFLVEPNLSWFEQTGRVLELVRTAQRAGRLHDLDAVRELEALASVSDEQAHRRLLEAADLVDADLPFVERLRVVASSLPDTVMTTSKFIGRAERVMSGIDRDLLERRASEARDETLEDVAVGVLDAVAQLTAALMELEQ